MTYVTICCIHRVIFSKCLQRNHWPYDNRCSAIRPRKFYRVTLCYVYVMSQKSNQDDTEIKFEEKRIIQVLDHFNVWDKRTFSQRYIEINEFFKRGGPLLLELNDAAKIPLALLKWSPGYTLAQKLNGIYILLEHRYYGESSPFENLTTENLIYLNVEQALEDVAYFIETYKLINPEMEHSKVAVLGCSYGGTLATWFRYKFPHLANAAWSSSAPLHFTLNFYQYYEVAGEVYSNVSSECIDIIRQGYMEARRLLWTTKGEEKVKAIFDGWKCRNVTEMSTTELLGYIRSVIADQYIRPGHDVTNCKFLQSKNATTTDFEQLAAFIRYREGEACKFEADDPNDSLAWNYQSCTQFVYSFTTNSRKQPFKDSYSVINNDLEFCAESFDEQFDKSTIQRIASRLNRVYGSRNLKVTKVVSLYGTHDPWRKMGFVRQPNKEAPVFLIPGVSHCADMVEMDETSPKPLIEAKAKALDIMIKWLQ